MNFRGSAVNIIKRILEKEKLVGGQWFFAKIRDQDMGNVVFQALPDDLVVAEVVAKILLSFCRFEIEPYKSFKSVLIRFLAHGDSAPTRQADVVAGFVVHPRQEFFLGFAYIKNLRPDRKERMTRFNKTIPRLARDGNGRIRLNFYKNNFIFFFPAI